MDVTAFLVSHVDAIVTGLGALGTGFVGHWALVRKQHADFLIWKKHRDETQAETDEHLERLTKSMGIMLELRKNDLTPDKLLEWHNQLTTRGHVAPTPVSSSPATAGRVEIQTMINILALFVAYRALNDALKNAEQAGDTTSNDYHVFRVYSSCFEERFGGRVNISDEALHAMYDSAMFFCTASGEPATFEHLTKMARDFLLADQERVKQLSHHLRPEKEKQKLL